MTKADSTAIGVLLIIGVPIYGIIKVGETMGWVLLVLLIISGIALFLFYKAHRTKKRRDALMLKYDDAELVVALMDEIFWQGQSSEQLLDSLGIPQDIDQKILKTKKKEVWKYNHQGGNRYGLRITLDNDLVVGWDQKS
ncbi:MAG: hypothetical protein JKY59_03125 [Emcibacter sp.]|nr:hypothetical protein [Emcibacter sp.]